MQTTGIKNLDTILGGGLPVPSAIALVGPLGCGKTSFARQLIANLLAHDYAVLYHAIDESMEDCKLALGDIGVNVEKHTQTNKLHFIDLFSKAVEKLGTAFVSGQEESVLMTGFTFSDLVELGRNFTMQNLGKKQFVVIDSINPLFLTANRAEVYQYCQTLKFATRFANAIGVAILHENVLDKETENAFLGFADGIVKMTRRNETTGREVEGGGYLKVVRMKNQKFSTQPFYYYVENSRILVSDMPVIF